jgi:2-methylisocitrate lyase-like PEP mutase family enzyme
VPSDAEILRELHRGPELLVLPNAWDVASARALAALPGCRALATTSGGVARALGYEDGENAPRDEMVAFAGRIAAAVDVPVTADLEAGYGDPEGTARAALDAGLAGINLEDSHGDALVPVEEQAELLRAVRAAAPELVVNARVDVYLRRAGGLDDAVARANAYLAAGADCAYPIFAPREDWADLARRIEGPVNVLVPAADPPLDELRRIGVRRATFGSGLAKAALDEATRLAAAALAK